MGRNNSFSEEQLTDSSYYIMLALLEPNHGYGIMQYVEDLTEKEVLIGPATLYTILKKMQDADFIELREDDNDRRKTYLLTRKGKEILTKDIYRRIKMADHGRAALSILNGGN